MPRSPYRYSERTPASRDGDARPPSRDRRGEQERNRKSRVSNYVDRPSGSRAVSSSQSDSSRERKSPASLSKKMDHKTPAQKRKPEDEYKIPKRPRKLRFEHGNSEEKETKKADEFEDQIKELKSDVRKKDQELAQLRKKANLKEKTIQKTEDLEGRNKKLLRENTNMKTEIADLNNELEYSKVKLKQSGESNTNISKKTSDDLARLRKERDSSKKELADIKEDLKATKDSLKLTRDENKLLAKERDDARNDLKEVEDNLGRVRGERELLKKTRRASDDLETQLSQMKICKEEAENVLQSRTREWFRKEKELLEKLASLDIDCEGSQESKHEDNGSADDAEVEANSTYCIEPEVTQVVSSDEEETPDTQKDLFESQDLILPSDEEFPDDTKEIKNHEVRNYRNPVSCLSTGMKTPAKYHNKEFKPVVTSLNNKVMFVSAGSIKTPHNDEYSNSCGLSPACNIKWSPGTFISRVCIIGSVSHPFNNKEVWCCTHHNEASIAGVRLQTQLIGMKHRAGRQLKPVTATKDTGSPVLEDDDEEVKVGGVKALGKEEIPVKKTTSKLSLRKSKKDGTRSSSSSKKTMDMASSSSSSTGEK